MRRIPSFQTSIFRRVFPVVWFGSLALVFVVSLARKLQGEPVPTEALWSPAAAAAFSFLLFRLFISNLATEVLETEDALLVSFGRRRARIPFRSILRISVNVLVSPAKATLHLREPCEFGREISFSPIGGVGPLGGSALVTELQERVRAAHASNPSIERTASSGLRPPPAAAHVER